MYLRAGVFSLGLLLISRLLGLARESAQAAAFGTSGLGDVVIVMFTLPDLLVGVLVSGALSYVLLPAWAKQSQSGYEVKLKRLTINLGVAALFIGVVLWVFRSAVVQALAPGLRGEMRALSAQSIGWSAAVLPLAMVAALWATRLQHARDFVGMYAGSVLVNMVLVAGLIAVGSAVWVDGAAPRSAVATLGGCLVLAMLLRLLWLAWRLSKEASQLPASASFATGALTPPAATVWLWAALASSLALVLPLAARSVVSQSGEGALASFNYAWKLIELPLVLALQLVASLAFPALAATAPQSAERFQALRVAFALAWALACAAAAAVATFSLPLANLLFGWGSMTAASLEAIARWSAVGVWSLLPQALIAVLLTLMAITNRMRVAVLFYACALAGLLVFGLFGSAQGQGVMWALNMVLAAAAVALLVTERKDIVGALPFVAMAVPLLVCVALVLLKPLWSGFGLPAALIVACAYALVVLASGAASSPALRRLVLLKLSNRGRTSGAF